MEKKYMVIKQSKKTILVTGGSGFVGSNLIPLLTKNDFNVINYDLKNNDDIRDLLNLEYTFETNNIDYVIHLAALTGARRGDEFYQDYIDTNIIGTKNLIKVCERYNIDKFIFFSSSSVLGGNMDKNNGLNELSKYKPSSIYGITKVAGEMLTKNCNIKNWIIIRPFTIYGNYGNNCRKDMIIYKWINQIKNGLPITVYGYIGDGKITSKTDYFEKDDLLSTIFYQECKDDSIRGYTYIEDLIKTILSITKDKEKSNIWNKIYHLGGDEKISLSHVRDLFLKECRKKKIDIKFNFYGRGKNDPQFSFSDSSFAKENLGFKPGKNFDKHVKNILKKELR